MTSDPDAEVLLEYSRIGQAVEVRAVSATDGLEVSFTVPANAAQVDIERLARAKLAYVRQKMRAATGKPGAGGRGGLMA